MAVAIPFIMLVAAGISAYSAVQQGKAAKAAADYNSEIEKQNADVSREEAKGVAAQQDRENFLRLGVIRANQGKSGGTNSGSVLDVIGDVAAQGELQKQTELYQGEMKARGYSNTSALDVFQGENARTGSYYKAGSELLGGASNAYTTDSKLKRT